jgi:23S rRNA pseudouridine1911/1915/1917 synthase
VAERTLSVGGAAGERLDAFVHRAVPGLSRRLVHRLIAEGNVRVNARRARKGTRLRADDHVTFPELPRLAPEPELPLTIVHEDPYLIVVDKPGGRPAHALDPRQRGTIAAALLARYPELTDVGDPLAPGLVHRLDGGTSGLLVAARTRAAHAALRAAFRAHVVEKRYLAVVAASAEVRGSRVTTPLAHDPGDRRRMIPAPPGTRAWPAATTVEAVTIRHGRALVAATIHTGVTHQVRVHLALLGHPVLGDLLYGGPPAGLPPGRYALHATELALPHPADGRRLTLRSPLPVELQALLED